MKTLFKTNTTVAILVLIIGILSISAFKSSEEKKQVMTIHLFDYASNPGIYVYVDGNLVEKIEVKKQSLGSVTETTAIVNKTINKYYNEGWRLNSVMPSIYLLEK